MLKAGRRWLVLSPLVLVAAPLDAHAITFHRVGPIASSAVSDANRYVAYILRHSGRITIRDTANDKSRRLRLPKGCRLVGFAGGRLILGCEERGIGEVPRLYSARTGRQVRLAGMTGFAQEIRACRVNTVCPISRWVVGAHWIQALRTMHVDGQSREYFDYTNLRTGRVVPSADEATEIEDIDHPRLIHRMCAPLRRTLDSPDRFPDASPFMPFFYTRPFGVDFGLDSSFKLYRCGRSHPILSISAGNASRLTETHFTWVTQKGLEDQRFHVMNLATGRRANWNSERFRGYLSVPSYAITRTSIFMLDFRDNTRTRASNVLYRARLP